jgi:hypothetical protein
MRDVLRLSWSIARSGWQSTYNRSWRFSRMKFGAIWLVLQAVFFIMIARRAPSMGAAGTAPSLGGILALMGMQMAWFGLMYGFSRGQMQLYQGLLVPLFQISPARPLAFILGRVIEAVPTRAWSTLLWAWVYARTVPGGARMAAVALLFLYGLAAGMLAHLSGLLLLALWSRISPKTMRNGTILFGAVTLAMATWAIIYLSEGGTVTHLAEVMRQYRTSATAGVLLLAGVPGLALLGTLAVRPESVEELYRSGLYQVIELGEQDVDRPGKSMWLPLGEGVLRAVLSREWLELYRSKVARVQLMIWAAGTVGVFVAGRAMAGQPMPRVIQFVGALSLLTWFMSYGHWPVRVFEKERKTMLLYRLAAISTPRLLLAKFISVFVPSAILVALDAAIGGLAAGVGGGGILTVMAWTLGALVGGVCGGFGLAAATAGEEPEEDAGPGGGAAESATAQASGPWWAIARTIALVVGAALPVWTGAGQPGLPAAWRVPVPALVGVDVVLPLAVLVIGVQLMVRSWEVNGQ